MASWMVVNRRRVVFIAVCLCRRRSNVNVGCYNIGQKQCVKPQRKNKSFQCELTSAILLIEAIQVF